MREVNHPVFSRKMKQEHIIEKRKKITAIREQFGHYMDMLDVYNSRMLVNRNGA